MGALALVVAAGFLFMTLEGIGFGAGTGSGVYDPGLSDLPMWILVLMTVVAFLAVLSVAGAVVSIRRALAHPGLGRALAIVAAVALVPVGILGAGLLLNAIGVVALGLLGVVWFLRGVSQAHEESGRVSPEPLPVTIRRVDAATTRPLRHAVLRPHQSITALLYPTDEIPDTGHFAAFAGDEVVGTASVHREPYPGSPDDGAAWRLRGMATAPAVRGTGVGSRLLAAVLDHAAANGGRLLWCNARVTAIGFYERHGLTVTSPEFDEPNAGPHVRMTRAVGVAN